MAHMIFCDVCEKPATIKQWRDDPGIEATIPPSLLGDLEVEGDDYTFCSWECLGMLVARYTSPDVKAVEEDLEEGETLSQIVQAEEPEVPPTGVYFPEGMKVDGKPAGQLRKR